MFTVGQPIPPALRNALKEETSFSDWVLVCAQEGNTVSPYNIRDIVRGCNIYENSIPTVERLIKHSISKADDIIAKKRKSKTALRAFSKSEE